MMTPAINRTPSSYPSLNSTPRWTREQIRAARMMPLLPLLQRRGLRLRELQAGNYEPLDFPGLLIKDSYWRWPTRDLAGNAIDFGMKVLKLSFHDTLLEITRR